MSTVDRKANIIEAATKSFGIFGYKATTMDQVATLANVGKGTIYTFFKNKEELFDEIISNLIFEMKQAADRVIDENLSFHENCHLALLEILNFRKKHQLTIKLFQEAREIGTPAVQEVLIRLETAVIQYLKGWIEKAIVKGEIQPCDPEITAFIIFKMYISLVFDWEKQHDPLDSERLAELLEFYLFSGLSKR